MKSLFYLIVLSSIGVKGNDLPQTLGGDIISILNDGIIDVRGNCTVIPDKEVEFWFYTGKSDKKILNSPNPLEIDVRKPIKILIHGFTDDPDIYYIQDMKNAYFARNETYQIITVNWATLAKTTYFTAFCNLPQVAKEVARFITNLCDNYKLDLSKLHIVGHSMGAHIAGIAGKHVKKNRGLIGRITGLDPAGPLYQGIPGEHRLIQDDAELVDVIHTNGGIFGYVGDCGSVDFHVNCADRQPGCIDKVVQNTASLRDLIQFPLNDVLCNHQRSCDYFTESIGNGKFVGLSTSTYAEKCQVDTEDLETLSMGEDMPKTFKKRTYLVFTNPTSPYAKATKNNNYKE